MQELISVVIPVYNSAPYLKECLDSVLKQTYKQLEIIIINDGSTDNSLEIIDLYTKKDSRFKLISQENHGLGYTRNRGIRSCTGKYIFFLDSDDLLPKNALHSLYKVLKESDADYAVGKVLRMSEERNYAPRRHIDYKLYEKEYITTIQESPQLLQDSIACNKLWRTNFLKGNELLFTEGKLYEDLTLTTKAAVLARKIAVITDTVYYWRIRENELTPSITQQQMRIRNTLDRLEALTANREWLISSDVASIVVQEHDVKCLLDVLRLHVSKYALTVPEERKTWETAVSTFLRLFPSDTLEKLPQKEMLLYHFVMNENYYDLNLFSQMETNTENRQVVFQENEKFILKGRNNCYDVTSFIKPVMSVKNVVTGQSKWIFQGQLTIPKASKQISGILYAVPRGKKDIKENSMIEFKLNSHNQIYPFDSQEFEFGLDVEFIRYFANEKTVDFYFKLEDDNAIHSRVRFQSALKSPSKFRIGKKVFTLYRTDQGNLSMSIKEHSLKHLFKKALKRLLSK